MSTALTRTGVLGVIVAIAVAAVLVAPAVSHAGSGSVSLRSLVAGNLDVDINSRSGATLGHLRGSVKGSGVGTGAFRAARGQQFAAQIVKVSSTKRGPSKARIRVKSAKLSLTLIVDASGAVSGSGTLAGKRVVANGAAGEALPDLDSRMKMLVIGKPSGEAYAALKKRFNPVKYNRKVHTREAFLDDRDFFHQFAALVFGSGAKLKAISSHPLLLSFAGTGKWVVVAPATKNRLDALSAIHAYDHGRAAPAVALRATGPQGDHDRVKPAVAYPEISSTTVATVDRAPYSTRSVVATSTKSAPGAKSRRQAWFLSQLRQFGDATIASARATAGVRSTASSSSSFSLPFNAAAIEIAVPFFHEFTVSGAGNLLQFRGCGWNQKDWNAWCPDTWYWRSLAGGSALNATTIATSCDAFLKKGYYMLNDDTRKTLTTKKDKDGAYKTKWEFDDGFILTPNDECPKDGTQTGVLQGTDYYYAIYEPGFNSHTLVVLTDPEVSAAEDGKLFRNDQTNGKGRIESLFCGLDTCEYVETKKNMKETAWFLAAYSNTLSLAGPQVGDTNFEYQFSSSFPNNTITVEEASKGTATTQGFSIGVFGGDGTASYSSSVTEDANVSIQVPDWTVSPTPAGREISYSWETNTAGDGKKLTWDTINGGCCTKGGVGASFKPNDLNIADFGPATLTAWEGAATYGAVTVTSTRNVHLADHLTWWSQDNRQLEDFFTVTTLKYGDNPNTITPVTKSPQGPGINLCDPAVMAPSFQGECGDLLPLGGS